MYGFEFDSAKPVEGPRGPHLFRASTTSSFEFREALSLSPITPKTARPYEPELRYPIIHDPLPPRSRNSPFQFTHEKLEPIDLVEWRPEQVAQWMLNAGIEVTIAEKFVENDINGAILVTLKFEDLRELDIQSFGVRTKVWEEIHVLRDSKAAAEASSPRPDTIIEDVESKEVRRERKRSQKGEEREPVPRSRSLRRAPSKQKPAHEDIISPLESVSIVGIEQMMPKPHHCSKGENCSRYRKQQRMIEAFKREHPFVDMEQGGIIMVAGDPGNPATAPAINRPSSTEALRPMSDAVPSVVASSDVFGPGMPPFQYLQEAALRNLQTRDPQDNVRQFLDFQHQDPNAASSEVPPTPPFEILPNHNSTSPTTPRAAQGNLRALPKLTIPAGRQQQQQQQQQRQSYQQRPAPLPTPPLPSQFPLRMDRGEALSPDLQNAPYRFGTPFSDMDVPLTAVPLGPVARDASQSVPPDMNYRAGPALARSQSRSSRRPSFQVMAPLEEHNSGVPTPRVPAGHQHQHVRHPSISPTTKATTTAGATSPPRVPSRQPLQAPPRAQYPWSPQARSTFAPLPTSTSSHSHSHSHSTSTSTYTSNTSANNTITPSTTSQDAEGITYAGPVKKRKTRMLRHEWHDQFATLKGTRMVLHRDGASSAARSRALEYIDIDDYAIACSSLSTGSRLNAAFKAMSISRSAHNADADAIAAFSFQLVPQNEFGGGGKGARLRKRESAGMVGGVGEGVGAAAAECEGAANGTGKTHHFAVRSRDERIDWMRELMLAKALKQKGEGFEVSVNGNMI